MLQLFQMWALVEVLGLVCLPLTVTVFHNVPDCGWAFSKAMGVVLLAFCVWLPLMVLNVLPYSQLFIFAVALIILACNMLGFLKTHHTIMKVVRVNIGYVIVTELVFLGMVFLLGYLRSYLPDINNYEMFMDEGFISSIMRSTHFPPTDMWFAGYSINYYYYAHFTAATLGKLLGQSPSIVFNTGISMFFGLTAVNLFGVTANIVAWARYVRRTRTQTTQAAQDVQVENATSVHPPLLRAMPYGFVSIVMALILGNLASTQQWFTSHGDGLPYDWFAPSRVVDKTINEFPAFSFLLSCFHAHVLTLAFTILAIGMAFNLFLASRGQEGRGLRVFGRNWQIPTTLLMTALVIGGLFVMNGWDYPTYMAFALVCIALQQWLAHDMRFRIELLIDIFVPAAILIGLSFLLFIPFYRTFISPSQGIGIVDAANRSNLRDELLIYGIFAFVYVSLLVASVLKRPLLAFTELRSSGNGSSAVNAGQNWFIVGVAATVALVVVEFAILLFVSNSVTFVVMGSIALLGTILLIVNIGDRAHSFTLLLGVTAFAVVAMCEMIFLKDVFASSYPRYNTVFKFYFQAWTLLSLASGAGLYFILESFKPLRIAPFSQRLAQRGVETVWVVVLVVFALAGSVYPLVAPASRLAHIDSTTGHPYLQRTNSLDGLSYLKTDPANPGDYDAILWLNTNVQGNPVIVEAVGDDYSNYGRISVFTGLPTIMGWVGHEYQWRVNWLNDPTNAIEFDRRYGHGNVPGDVDTIYTNPDPATVLSIMSHYKAQYLYVGALEYRKYPMVNLHRFSSYMQVVYNAEGVTIYKVR